MNTANSAALEQALAACASEPIHQLGSIQPHGALVVFNTDERHTILQVSANLGEYLKCPAADALGQSLTQLLGIEATLQIETLLQPLNAEQNTSLLLNLTRQQTNLELEASIYQAQGFWMLELFQAHGLHNSERLGDILIALQSSLQLTDFSAHINDYFERITHQIRELTGYDSVMVYRFNAEHEGQVLAQSKVALAPSYLGHYFPAGDIPPQARALYTKNVLRMVANVADKPIALLPAINPLTQQPLDMTQLALRSLSPVHIEYLRNMGVTASLSLSLLQHGQLWGLIVCHHLTPKRPTVTLSKALVFISRMISSELSALLARDQQLLVSKAADIKRALLKSILHQSEESILSQLGPQIMEFANATGLIVVIEGHVYTQGLVPKTKDIDALLDWLSQQSVTNIYHCHHLSEHYPAASAYTDIVSGVLDTALNTDMSHSIIWCRKAAHHTRQWAGDYEQGLSQNAAGDFKINPRNSFKTLQRSYRGRSEPWSAYEIQDIHQLALTLIESLVYKKTLIRAEAERLRLHELTLETERKRIKTLANLHKITNCLPGAVFQLQLHADGHISFPYASIQMTNLFRVSLDEIKHDATPLFNQIHPDDLAGVLKALTESSVNFSLFQQEFRICLEDGTERWLQSNALPDEHLDGSCGGCNEIDDCLCWYGYISDITKNKQLIQQSENIDFLWNFAIDGIGDGVWDRNIQTNETYYSPQWKAMLGYRDDEISNKSSSWIHQLHPDYQQLAINTFEAYVAGSIPIYELEIPFRTKQGDYLWVLSRGKIVSKDSQGRPIRIIGTHIDISLRKSMELKLKEDRDILALSQNIANLGNWSYAPRTDTIVWSDQMYVIYGINKADFGHNLGALMTLLHPDDHLLQRKWLKQLAQPLPVKDYLVRILRPDGNLRYLKVYATVEYTADGQLLRIIGCSQDVTESILSEQKDLVHLDQLAHITRLGLMGEMATGIAHEVNQPLTAATNYASALKILTTVAEPDLEKITKIASLVAEQTLRAGKIIHRMKAFCQNQNTSSTSTDINTLIKECLLLCNSDLKKHNITLNLALADALPMLLVDAIKIEQVLINLIRNSTEALTINDNPTKTITLSSLMLDENQLQIQVRDNGSGIEQALQEKLFMPFVTTKTEGMGMGLSICRSLIVAHRGTLTFDSQPGLGTCFYITLPIPENLE